VRADYLFFGLFALAKFMLHLMAMGRYGIFRDEYYYLACADHLAFGYVDQPPLSILLLHVTRFIFGDGVWAIRMPAVIASTAVVFLVGMTTQRLGGQRFAQAVACLAAVICPLFLAIGGYFSMNAFDHLFWAAAIYVLVRLIQDGDSRWWYIFGIIAGLGLMNKISMLFLGGALVVGMLLTPQRQWFKERRLYYGGLIALFIFLPHVIWQVFNGFPTLEFMANAAQYKNAALSPIQYLIGLVIEGNPVLVPVWVAGCIFGLRGLEGRYRLFSIMFLVILIFLALTNSKTYYFAPAFLLAWPLGAVWLERFGESRVFVRPAIVYVLAFGGLATVPLAIPVLNVQQFVEYQETLRLAPTAGEKGHEGAPIPQHFADRFGWKELADVVEKAYNDLPEADQEVCTVLASNYGQAGSLEYYAKRRDLPPMICGHNNYYLWGPGDATGEVMIAVGFDRAGLEEMFASVEEIGRTPHPFAMPYESNKIIYLCRGLKVPVAQAWPQLKHFI
jgi:hypothetical protein